MPHISSKAVRTARCTGWSTSTYSAAAAEPPFSVRKPACLPEQLLWSWLGRAVLVAQPVALGRVLGHLRAAAQVGLAEPELVEPGARPG